MSLSKSVSVLIGGLAAALIAATLFYARQVGWPTDGSVLTFIGLLALIGGGSVAVASVALLSRYDIDLRRLCTYIENLGNNERHRDESLGSSLEELQAAVDDAVGRLHQRIDQLSRSRRDLEFRARLSESERLHTEAVINTQSDGLLILDEFQEVVAINSAGAGILEVNQFDVRNQPLDHAIPSRSFVQTVQGMSAVPSAHGIDATSVEWVKQTQSDSTEARTFELTSAALPMPAFTGDGMGKSRMGTLVTIRDITSTRAADGVRRDFVANVSHELKTPLASIRAYVEMLADGEVKDEATREEFYAIIQSESNRLSRLIENLLQISRIESGVLTPHRELVPLPQVIEQVIDVMKPHARSKHIELVGDTSPVFFPVFADRDLLYQALMNLVNNAVKYTREGGRVEVLINRSDDESSVAIAVRDSGVGIPESDIPRLFDKFYRVADHKKLATGIGLGLNLVKHIVETMHGGNIRVESRLNAGSTFTLTLPLTENEYGSRPVRAGGDPQHEGGPTHEHAG